MTMQIKKHLLIILLLAGFMIPQSAQAALITFDDIAPDEIVLGNIQNGYAGLNWDNIQSRSRPTGLAA